MIPQGEVAPTTAPDDPGMVLITAEGLMSVRRDLEAISTLSSIGPMVAEWPRARTLTAIAMWNEGLDVDALAEISALAEQLPDDANVHQAWLWIRMVGRYDEDAMEAARAWAVSSEQAGAADPWARFALSMRQSEQLRLAAQHVAAYRPAGGQLLLGHADLFDGRWTQAVDRYARASTLDPSDPIALIDGAYALGRTRQHNAAEVMAFRATELEPEDRSGREALRRAVDGPRGPLRRIATAGATLATLAVGGPSGSGELALAVVGAIIASIALMRLIWTIRATPPDVRAAYVTISWRTRPLLIQHLQGVGIGYLVALMAISALSFLDHPTEDSATTVLDVVVAASLLVGYVAIRRWKRRRGLQGADLRYPWTQQTPREAEPAAG